MKLKLLVPLLLCALTLAGCYRQTEEPFQQVDSAAVDTGDATPTSVAVVDDREAPPTNAGGQADSASPERTPESGATAGVETRLNLPTAVPELNLTDAPLSVTRFVLPSPTQNFAEQLDGADPCVYTVLPGDNLFRLSLSWETTVPEIMDLNEMDSNALSIGQLILQPGCEQAPAAATATPANLEPAPGAIATDPQESPSPEPTATPGPRVHVVSSGETLETISLRYRADVNQIIALNQLDNPNRLTVGQELLIPE